MPTWQSKHRSRAARRCRRRLGFLAALYLAGLGVALLYPFTFAPPNGVHWLEGTPGLYFEEAGIAETPHGVERSRGAPLGEITVELWLVERRDSRNWGPRVIFSLYPGGSAHQSISLAEYGGRLLLAVPPLPLDEPWWAEAADGPRLRRGEEQFVAFTLGAGEKAIFRGDDPPVTRPLAPGAPPIRGRVVLGNAANGRYGWWGEVRGVAIHRRVLARSELDRDRARVRGGGVAVLANDPDVIAVFPLAEGRGSVSRGLPVSAPRLDVPARFRALPASLLDLADVRRWRGPGSAPDLAGNVALFVPLGLLLALRGGGGIGSAAVAVALAALASTAAETTQLLIPTREASAADVLCNVVGAGLGAALASPFFGAR